MPEFPKPTKPYELVRKDTRRIFRLMAWFLDTFGFLDRKVFMERFWTTYDHTIGYRVTLTQEQAEQHTDTVDHELVHIWRKEKLGAYLYTTLYIGPSVTFWLPLVALLCLAQIPWTFSWWFVLGALAGLLACLPLTFGLAWGRFFIEREAYWVQVSRAPWERRRALIEHVANTLWKNYARTWPPSWTIAYFEAKCEAHGLPCARSE